MRGLAFLLSVLFIPFVQGQELDTNDCNNYKTGDFYVINGTDTCFISRTENRQKESCTNSEDEYELIVIWLKDNKYILRDIHYNPTTAKRTMRNDVIMTIIETGEDYHVVHLKSRGQKKRLMTVYCNKKAE